MPMETFTVWVEVSSDVVPDSLSATAEASRYLAHADTTSTFGYGGRVSSVETELVDGWWLVALTFEAPIVDDDALRNFMREMTTLAHVESVERMSNTNL